MANIIKAKRSSVPGKVPTTSDLALGEIGINTYDGKAYIKKDVGGVESIVSIAGAGAGDVNGPASSTDNAITRFDGVSGKIIQNSIATLDDSGNLTALTSSATGTGSNKMPVGTTAQRPGSPSSGMYRMNSTTGEPEWYDSISSTWVKFRELPTLNTEYIIVAGGGGAASGWGGIGGGGAGAGGRLFNTASFVPGSGGRSVVIGAGGAGATSVSSGANGNQGSASSFNSQSTVGGGFATSWITGNAGGSSGSGGSGGGGTWTTITPGSGTSGQGFAGGNGSSGGPNSGGGGGGGATAVGQNGTSSIGGAGGAGYTWLNSTAYAGGGGGGGTSAGGAGAGGDGGGGAGGGGASGSNGTANRGGGGGGGGGNSGQGGSGGSGVVIIRYLGTPRATGGTITESGGYTYHTFTTSGTFTP
jgi:hypothetical protein